MAAGREPFWSGATAFWESQKKDLLDGFAAPMPAGAEDVIQAGLRDPATLAQDSFHVARSFLAPIARDPSGRHPSNRLIHNDLTLRLSHLLLVPVDMITMAS